MRHIPTWNDLNLQIIVYDEIEVEDVRLIWSLLCLCQ